MLSLAAVVSVGEQAYVLGFSRRRLVLRHHRRMRRRGRIETTVLENIYSFAEES